MLSFWPVFQRFAFGGMAYGILETIFRGYTHWSMGIAGGLCFCLLYQVEQVFEEPLWKKCLLGSGIITTVEYVTGCIVNLWLDWNVWSYSNHAINLDGQICLLFSALWALLSVPIFYLSRFMQARR